MIARGARIGDGTSGRDLERELLRVAHQHHQHDGVSDVVVLVDDVDCRFLNEGRFVVDWTNGFGAEFDTVAHSLRRRLSREMPDADTDLVEHFGGPEQAGGGCTHKLSARIAELIKTDPDVDSLPPSHREYSKRIHGPDMLRRIEPERVARTCTEGMRPGWQELKRLRDHYA